MPEAPKVYFFIIASFLLLDRSATAERRMRYYTAKAYDNFSEEMNVSPFALGAWGGAPPGYPGLRIRSGRFAAAAHPSYPLRGHMRAKYLSYPPLHGVPIYRISHKRSEKRHSVSILPMPSTGQKKAPDIGVFSVLFWANGSAILFL
jgi:hypothetical protein